MFAGTIRFALVLSLFATFAEAQIRLGELPADRQLRIQLDQIVPISRLRVEIDGQTVDVPLAFSGRTLVVTLPEDLQGRAHDLVIYRRQPDVDVELGIWSFTTQSGLAEASLVGTFEMERREGAAGGRTSVAGNGRLGFSIGGDLLRGGIGLVQSGTLRRGGLRTEVSDYFVENRSAVLGQDLYTRLGSQGMPVESILAEEGSWRGASFRLTSPDGRSDAMAFAVNPRNGLGLSNLTGLGDADSRVNGVAARVFPISTSSVRVDVLGFGGRADLGRRKSGEVTGRGLRLSGPIGADLGDFALDYAGTTTQKAGGALTKGSAAQAEVGFALLPADAENSLELRLSGARIDQGFYSPLNPDLITGEATQRAELLFQSDEVQWSFHAGKGRSNIADDTAVPTDRFRDAGLDLAYSPYVFTGGFPRGVTFYGSLYTEDQTRIFTPAGGPRAQDFRLQSLSLGMDRFMPDHSWAVGLKLDWLDDLSGRAASERRQRIEAAYAFTPDDLTTLTLRAEAGREQRSGSWRRDGALEMSLAFPILPDLWSGYVEVGATRSEGRRAKAGSYFGVEIERALSDQTSLMVRADYGDGVEADTLAPAGGWTFALALRHEFGAGAP